MELLIGVAMIALGLMLEISRCGGVPSLVRVREQVRDGYGR